MKSRLLSIVFLLCAFKATAQTKDLESMFTEDGCESMYGSLVPVLDSAKWYIMVQNRFSYALDLLNSTDGKRYFIGCGNAGESIMVSKDILKAKCYIGLNQPDKAIEILLSNCFGMINGEYLSVTEELQRALLTKYSAKQISETVIKAATTVRLNDPIGPYRKYKITLFNTDVYLNGLEVLEYYYLKLGEVEFRKNATNNRFMDSLERTTITIHEELPMVRKQYMTSEFYKTFSVIK